MKLCKAATTADVCVHVMIPCTRSPAAGTLCLTYDPSSWHKHGHRKHESLKEAKKKKQIINTASTEKQKTHLFAKSKTTPPVWKKEEEKRSQPPTPFNLNGPSSCLACSLVHCTVVINIFGVQRAESLIVPNCSAKYVL